MRNAIEQLIDILEDKKSISKGVRIDATDLLDSIIREANTLNQIPEGLMTKMRLRSGHFFDFANPRAEDFEESDIARGLATEYRYGGQTKKPYSVAQHAYYCSLEPGTTYEQYERLHHDDSEGLMKDMPKPLKNLLPDYEKIEARVTKVMNDKLGLPFPHTESCHRVDKEIFEWEYKGLMLGEYEFDYWDAEKAERMYMKRHYELLEKLKAENNEL